MFDRYTSHKDNALKINITIELTNTNEIRRKCEIFQELVPAGKTWVEHGEWNYTNFEGTTSASIQIMLEDINKILDCKVKNKNTHVYQLNFSINSPDGGHCMNTDSDITLKKAQEMILANKQAIKLKDSMIEKSICTRIFGKKS